MADSIASYRRQEAGYMDRANALPPEALDLDYLRGYFERIIFEVDRQRQGSRASLLGHCVFCPTGPPTEKMQCADHLDVSADELVERSMKQLHQKLFG